MLPWDRGGTSLTPDAVTSRAFDIFSNFYPGSRHPTVERRQRQKGFSPMVYVNMQHFVLFTYTYENATFGTKIKIQGMQEFEFSFAAQTLPTGSASDVKVWRQFGFRRSKSFSGMLKYSKKVAKRSLKRRQIGNSFRGKNNAPIPPHFGSRLLI